MDVLLVSGKSGPDGPHPSRAAACALAAELIEGGHRVRWLCPIAPGEAPPPGRDRLVVIASPFRPVPFRKVQRRLVDPPLELALTRQLRDEPPDIVHLLTYGGSLPPLLPWLAARMGVPVVVCVALEETLCHRGTLVDETGAACGRWDEPPRCAVCCCAPWQHGLSRFQAALARALRPLGGLSPFPSLVDFQNRFDLIVHGLLSTDRVVVGDEAARQAVLRAGVRHRQLVVARAGMRAADWLAIWAECAVPR